MNTKKKKIIILISAILLCTLIGIIACSLLNRDPVNDSLDLGNKYLSELDYDAAIREYSKVIELDPINITAMEGLAKSYAGKDDLEMLTVLLENELSSCKNRDILSSYAQLLEAHGDYTQAVHIITQLIQMEDADEDYTWLDSVIKKHLNTRYEYSENSHVSIQLRDNGVYTKGNNILGALGTAKNIPNNSVDEFIIAEFPEIGNKVFTIGAGAAVIDTSDNLWLSGSNRSGQKGMGQTELHATNGWTQITAIPNVAKVSGKSNVIYILTNDGKLFFSGSATSGNENSYWTDKWTELTGYGKIMDIQCGKYTTAFLTAEGKLYSDFANNFNPYTKQWNCIANNVNGFSISSGGGYGDDITYFTYDNTILTPSGNIYYPENWTIYTESSTYYEPPFSIKKIARTDDSLFFLSTENTLYYLNNASLQELTAMAPVENIYTSNNKCVVILENSGYQLLDSTGNLVE